MKAYVLITVKMGKLQDMVAKLADISGVKTVHACWGLPDIFAFVEATDEADLNDLVLSKIQLMDGVERTDTHIVLET